MVFSLEKYLLRLSKKFKIEKVEILGSDYPAVFGWYRCDNTSLKTLGDRLLFCFSSGKNMKSNRAYLVTCDRKLKEKPTISMLPMGGLTNASHLGMTLHPDGFLVAIGERGLGVFDNEVKAIRLIKLNFDGEVVGKPFLMDENIVPSVSVVGPVFDGKGFFFFYTRREGKRTFNSCLKTDINGVTISGPRDLGDAIATYEWFDPVWAGKYVTSLYFEWTRFSLSFSMFNDKGNYIMNPIAYLDGTNMMMGHTFHAYSGLTFAVVYGAKLQKLGTHLFSNAVSLPASVKKPIISYFGAGAMMSSPADHRLIMWACTGSSSVLIKGKGVKLKNQLPVGSAVVDTKGTKLVLRMTVRGPGGKVKKKLVLK